uniref:Uncharacterized protein n=1 Tax=Noccaea caerulescens TaxID=107243 RepID=A0A1J3DP03_NOCCA
MIAGFKVSTGCLVTLLFVVAESLTLLSDHIQSRVYGFFGCRLVATSGHFGMFTEILYGSLPRPPEDLYDVSFHSLHFIRCSLSQNNGGLLAAVSHYRQLIGKFIYLKVTRSSVGFASHNDTWISKQQAVVSRRSEEAECTSMANATYELDWFSNRLHDLHIQWVDYVALFCDNQAALHILNHFVSLELLQQILPEVLLLQRRSLYYGFLDHKLLTHSGWFRSILDFLYCSLPRPPEEHFAFTSTSR